MGKRGHKLPPLSFGDLERVVKADGWVRVEGTKHENYEHPTKSGKVSLDKKWTGVVSGGWVFRSVLQQAGLTRAEFEALYWSTR